MESYALRVIEAQRLFQMPCDCLTFPIKVSREENSVTRLNVFFQFGQNLFAAFRGNIGRLKVRGRHAYFFSGRSRTWPTLAATFQPSPKISRIF